MRIDSFLKASKGNNLISKSRAFHNVGATYTKDRSNNELIHLLLIGGTPLLYECITFSFTCMIKHSFASGKFAIFTIVPIHKGSNLKASDSKNYRDVSLSSLFSKILDNCILIMQSDSLQSDPLQFAYKENASTVQCASVICEVINYKLIMIVVFIYVCWMHQKHLTVYTILVCLTILS